MAQRKKSTQVAVQVGVLEERLNAYDRELPELKEDVKAILATVQQIQIEAVKVPKWEDLKGVETRVEVLENGKQQVTGGLKVLVAISSVLGGAAGWLVSYFSSPAPHSK